MRLRLVLWLLLSVLHYLWTINLVVACPFCPALQPTLAQLRDGATVAVLATAGKPAEQSAAPSQPFQVFRALKFPLSGDTIQHFTRTMSPALPPGTLVFAWTEDADPASALWRTRPLSELAAAYAASVPDLRQDAAQRLRWFIPYLEHADPEIALDAQQEFAHADFATVREVVPNFDQARLRDWLTDPQVPPEHRGFYGMLAGLACATQSATQPVDSATPQISSGDAALHREALTRLVWQKRDDFRAGYDGLLAGYLLAEGEAGLAAIWERILRQTDAPSGDLRHAASALRFYHEFGPTRQQARVETAVALLLNHPETAAAAITDLGRWKYDAALPRVVAWYRDDRADTPIRRSVVGYLRSLGSVAARQELDLLRAQDPAGVAQLEAFFELKPAGPAK
ncbi:MAG: hypothetical protein SFX18_14240 [Pirellulales bacterium]|nr:hypothetical protein [Pirellulales bacterium]